MERAKRCGSIFRNGNDVYFYQCEFCDQKFSSSMTFESHTMQNGCQTRSNDLPEFICNSCGEKIDNNEDQSEHEETQHYELKCHSCDESSKTSNERSEHFEAKHESEPELNLDTDRYDNDNNDKFLSFLRGMIE